MAQIRINVPAAGLPQIIGSPIEDQTLSVDLSNLDDGNGLPDSFSYQWMRNGIEIASATASEYTLTDADVLTNISVKVFFTDQHGFAEQLSSEPTAAITNVNDLPNGEPVISGVLAEDEVLTATWDNVNDDDGEISVTKLIWKFYDTAGELSHVVESLDPSVNQVILDQGDVGKSVELEITYSDPYSLGETITSNRTEQIANVNDTVEGDLLLEIGALRNFTKIETLSNTQNIIQKSVALQNGSSVLGFMNADENLDISVYPGSQLNVLFSDEVGGIIKQHVISESTNQVSSFFVIKHSNIATKTDHVSIIWEETSDHSHLYIQEFYQNGFPVSDKIDLTSQFSLSVLETQKIRDINVTEIGDGQLAISIEHFHDKDFDDQNASSHHFVRYDPVSQTITYDDDVWGNTLLFYRDIVPFETAQGMFTLIAGETAAGYSLFLTKYDGERERLKQDVFDVESTLPIQREPDAVTLSNGNVAVVFQTGNDKTEAGDIYVGLLADDALTVINVPTKVNASQNSINFEPEVLALSSGGFVVVWQNTTSEKTSVLAKKFDDSGVATTEVISLAENVNDVGVPSVSIGPQDVIHVTYFDAAESEIRSERVDSDTLNTLTFHEVQKAPIGYTDTSITPSEQVEHEFAVLTNYNTVFAYRNFVDAETVSVKQGSGLELKLLDPNGNILSESQIVSDNPVSGFQIVQHTHHENKQDHFTLIWQEYTSISRIYLQEFDENGSPAGEKFDFVNEVEFSDRLRFRDISATELSDGTIAFTVEHFHTYGSASSPLYAVYDPESASITSHSKFWGYTDRMLKDIGVFESSGSQYIFVSHENSAGADQFKIYVKKLTAGEDPSYYQAPISFEGNQLEADFATLRDGSVAIVWQTQNQGEQGDVYAAIYNDDLTNEIVAPIQVNSSGNSDNVQAELISTSDGGFIVSWNQTIADVTNIVAKKFDANGSASSDTIVLADGVNPHNEPKLVSLKTGEIALSYVDESTETIILKHVNPDTLEAGDFLGNTPIEGETLAISTINLSDEDGLGDFNFTWERGRDDNGSGVLESNEWSLIPESFSEHNVSASNEDIRISEGDVWTYWHGPVNHKLSDGKFAVVWNENNTDGDGLGVFASVVDTSGTILVDKFQVSDNAIDDQKYPNVEVLKDGNFIVSWHEWSESAGSGKIYQKTFDVDGSVVSAQSEISNVTWKSAEVRSLNLTDATFVTTYADTSAQIFDYDGNVIKAEFRLSDSTNFEEGNARLAETEDGFAAFWTRHNGDENLHGSMARYFNDAGEPITDVFVVNQTIESYQSITDATTLSNGNILVMWTSKNQDGDNHGQYARILDGAGNFVTDEFIVNETTSGNQTSGRITSLSDGGFFAVYSSGTDTGNQGDYTVLGQRFDETGQKLGTEVTIPSNSQGYAKNPSINEVEPGLIAVSWTAEDMLDNSGVGVATKLIRLFESSETYTLSQNDVGYFIRGTVSYTDGYGTDESVSIITDTAVLSLNDEPIITGSLFSGTLREAETLTFDLSTLADEDGLPTDFSYQWKRAGEIINGAVAASYTLTTEDVGKEISLTVTYTDLYYTAETVTYTGEDVVNDIPSGGVVLTGDLFEGKILSADVSTVVDADGINNPSITWYSGIEKIDGAVGSNYTLSSADVGSAITARYTFTDGQGVQEVVSSSATAAINAKISGTNDADTLEGTINPEYIVAGSGDDRIFAFGGDDLIDAGLGDDFVSAGDGNDVISGGSGADNLKGDEGADTIYLSGEQTHAAWSGAWNASNDFQTGTNEIIALSGLTQIDAVVDGGAGADTVALTSSSDAFFLHAALTSFHEDLSLSADYDGELSVPKFANVEIILAGDGDDVIDLTSPDYSLSGDTISIKGQDGDDTIWGSDADEEIIGGDGKDVIFGGAGINTLTGGTGADEFQFTATSTQDTITDLSLSEGDTLKFFNSDTATFNSGSVSFSDAGISINFEESSVQETLFVNVDISGMSSEDLSAAIMVV